MASTIWVYDSVRGNEQAGREREERSEKRDRRLVRGTNPIYIQSGKHCKIENGTKRDKVCLINVPR